MGLSSLTGTFGSLASTEGWIRMSNCRGSERYGIKRPLRLTEEEKTSVQRHLCARRHQSNIETGDDTGR